MVIGKEPTALKYVQSLKWINNSLSLLPLILAISLYTLFFRAKSYGIIEIKGGFIPPEIYYHYKLTEALFVAAFFALIPNFLIMIFLVYLRNKYRISITMHLLLFLAGLFATIYMMRIDHPDAVAWFVD
jgi:hypothetical protein